MDLKIVAPPVGSIALTCVDFLIIHRLLNIPQLENLVLTQGPKYLSFLPVEDLDIYLFFLELLEMP